MNENEGKKDCHTSFRNPSVLDKKKKQFERGHTLCAEL